MSSPSFHSVGERGEQLPLSECLPEEFMALFSEEKDIIWHGSGVAKDIKDTFGIDVGTRYIDSGFVLDTMISRGTLCHYTDKRPRTGLLWSQIAMWGRDFIIKTFLPKSYVFHEGNKTKRVQYSEESLKKSGWKGMMNTEEDEARPNDYATKYNKSQPYFSFTVVSSGLEKERSVRCAEGAPVTGEL
jgi:hypothetical protein